FFLFFFFQAEDGIRDYKVTGVQTCALPISAAATMTREVDRAARIVRSLLRLARRADTTPTRVQVNDLVHDVAEIRQRVLRSENEIGRASCRERVKSAGGDGGAKKRCEAIST